MAKRVGTDGSLLVSLPWTVFAVSFAILPHVPFLPLWVTLVYASCACGRLIIERRRWRLPPTWLRLVLAVGSFLGIYASLGTISGVGPGSALLAVMAALKFMETRQRRDQFVLLFISIFLIMASLLREQFVWSLPYLIAGVLVTMTAWLRMTISRSENANRTFGTASRLVLYAAPLMLAMWIFFPRLGTPLWSVPIDTSSGATGLSDSMSPGDISSLSVSNEVAFRARFEGAAPPPIQRYWRGLVLTRFNGRTWNATEPSIGERSRWALEYFGEPLRYQVTMEPTRQRWILALDLAYEWSLEQTFMAAQQQLVRAQPIDQRIVYDAVSYPSFKMAPELHSTFRRYYLRLPDGSNPRTRRYAEDMRAQYPDDRALIDAVLAHFNEQDFYYTLQPPALGQNSMDQFLFDTRRGFCEHYASAFAVMMRSAGIPARVVVGYQGGELNPMSDYLIVRQSDAHAWTEVWLDDDGWVRVDPTAAVAPERIEYGMSASMFDAVGASWGLTAPSRFVHQLTYAWDLINAKWNEWILAYGPDNQQSLMEWLGMENPNVRKMLLTLITLLAALLAGITGLLILRFRPPPKDRATRVFEKFVRQTGVAIQRGEAPLAFAQRLRESVPSGAARRAADDVVREYLALRYGFSSDLSTLRDAVKRHASAA